MPNAMLRFRNEERDLRTELDNVKLAVLESRAILLSTTARPPISSPPRALRQEVGRKPGNTISCAVGVGARGSFDEGERGSYAASSGPCRGTRDSDGHNNTVVHISWYWPLGRQRDKGKWQVTGGKLSRSVKLIAYLYLASGSRMSRSRDISVSTVSGYGLNYRAIQDRSPVEATKFSSNLCV
jgi:hypothetical protein